MGVESPQSDADLLEAARQGNAAAYGELYERHVAAARALARQLVRGAEVEDVVAESFTKILDLVGRGGGPDSGFRTYLLTVVRRTVYDRSRVESRQVTTGEIELYDPGVPFVDPALVGLEKSLIARAYLSLPERWRAVLWHTEVERAKPADVAPLLGLSANGVAALAYRAREGLRQAYLQMHLGSPPQHDCRPVLGKMGAYVRGGLARRDSKAVDEHVSGCEECHGVLLELTDVNRGLRVMVGPLIAGPLFGGYAAALAKPGVVGAGGALRLLGRLRRVPKQQQVAVAGGTVVVTAAVLASLLLVADEQPIVRPPSITPVAQPPASVAPVPVPVPMPSERPVEVPPPVKQARPGKARLRATIDALGSLVRAQPGIVGIRLRNYGESPSEELAAQVDLPDGVTLVPPARRGHSAALLDPVGTVDGWACRPVRGGARCARGALQAGQGTAVFLRVLVADEAPEGAGPALRVAAGSLRLQARAEEGVRVSGAPARFATDGKVAVRAIGNTLLSCPAERAGCQETRRRQGTQRDNDLWPMTRLDQDERSDTASSSGAELTLPRGSEVVWAGLYWSATGDEAGPVKLRPPGRRKYTTVQPGEVTMRELPLGPVYQAFADVTELVGDVRRNGTWWAADVPMKEGVSRHAGWSLVLIVTDPAEPYSQAVVLDTATVVGGQARRMRVPLGGLSPAAAPARVELVTWEGDADLRGDKVSLGSGALAPGGGDRDPANVFDGSSNGVAGMTFGTDVDTVGAELGVDPGLTIVTDKDVVLFGVAALSVRARS
ncbi:sigma-70 family RNA polymerase sigma factor [Nonomuraea gerenzanensis]|uniref:Putative membrane protein n=1 Tax=Nonomuraea gerenzanensis TaxID=93944 RepID=A0A1M4DY03_9ACTN|nr:sigma-70 family RNA polymerase sigma factor [Nonomuraea gerenzanensis]UBU13722.1 sigma-70 family RNA polymerase sigma factor [Nonomuraea gerenzanensis]SBO91390.1 putative membrane protein [Nonomuraea gerenzanensis]